MNMSDMYRAAVADRDKSGNASGVSATHLANGGMLFCSVKFRAANSRGFCRAVHQATTWHYRPNGAEFSAQCSAQEAKELLETFSSSHLTANP